MNIKLLKDLDFATKISEAKAATPAGQDFLKGYKGYLFSNPATCSLVNNFVREATNYSYDTGLVSILESVNKYISDNKISWQLASACEHINENNSPYGYLAKTGINQVEKLLEQNEADVVSYIKAGALKGVMYIPEFRSICKQVYKTQITESHHVNYDMTTPISYVKIDENNNEYFSVHGHNFVVNENSVSQVDNVNDNVYNFMNRILESFTKEGDNLFYEYKNGYGEMVRFSFVTEGEDTTLHFKKGSTTEKTYNTPSEFMEGMSTLSMIMPIREKMQFMNICKNISTVFENVDGIVELDNVKYITTNNNFAGAIIEGKDNVNLSVFHSVNAGSFSRNYNYMVEALKDVTSMTGLDLAHVYENRIDEDCKKMPTDEQKEIQESLEATKDAQFAIRKRKIAMLAESYKNDPVKLSLLNKIAKDLNALEK